MIIDIISFFISQSIIEPIDYVYNFPHSFARYLTIIQGYLQNSVARHWLKITDHRYNYSRRSKVDLIVLDQLE